jgi:hypothetical protein
MLEIRNLILKSARWCIRFVLCPGYLNVLTQLLRYWAQFWLSVHISIDFFWDVLTLRIYNFHSTEHYPASCLYLKHYVSETEPSLRNFAFWIETKRWIKSSNIPLLHICRFYFICSFFVNKFLMLVTSSPPVTVYLRKLYTYSTYFISICMLGMSGKCHLTVCELLFRVCF